MKLSPAAILVPFALVTHLLSAQSSPSPAPGLTVPAGGVPYALDHFEGKPELVPVHHSSVEVNNHKGSNMAGAVANPFFKPKMTTELAGSHARTVLHDTSPSFYVHFNEEPDGAGDTPASESIVFALVHVVVDKDRRILAQVKFTQLTGNAKRNDGIIDTQTEHLPGGWIKLSPRSPLTPGEYAVTPIPKSQNAFSTTVFDFTLDPTAPNAKDALQPRP